MGQETRIDGRFPSADLTTPFETRGIGLVGEIVCGRTKLDQGVYYSATDMEARFCRNSDAIIIGGGNSAEQAAMLLSRYATHVHVLVRGHSLTASMSSYLSHRLEADPRITIHYQTKVVALGGENSLERVPISGPDGEQDIFSFVLFINGRGGAQYRLDRRSCVAG